MCAYLDAAVVNARIRRVSVIVRMSYSTYLTLVSTFNTFLCRPFLFALR